MFKKMKGLISLLLSIAVLLCTAVPMTAYAADTQTESKLYSPSNLIDGFLNRASSEGLVSNAGYIKSIWFVNKNDYDLTDVTTVDYSARKDGSVLAWYDQTNSGFYIGGNGGKIIAGSSLKYALGGGTRVDAIHGLELLDVSNVTDMSYMFSGCGHYSDVFTLDLGDNFDTSNVTNMQSMFQSCGRGDESFTLDLGDKFDTSKVTNMAWMFQYCGAGSKVFTLDLGDKFDTSKVTDMSHMFYYCGQNCETFTLDLSGCNFDTSSCKSMRDMFASCGEGNENFTLNLGSKFNTAKVTDMAEMFWKCGNSSTKFTELDLSGFTVSITDSRKLADFASEIPVTSFIFGAGWANAVLPTWKTFTAPSTASSNLETTVTGATSNLVSYSWDLDKRTATFPDKTYYTITAAATEGGSAWNGGSVPEGGKIELLSSADSGYRFDGWYDGDTMVCDTTEFLVENVTGEKTYTAKFTKISVLFETDASNTLLSKAVEGGLVKSINSIKSVSFVDLNSYDLTGIKTVDYSAEGDGRTLAWYDEANSALYIGGEGKVVGEGSLAYAFYDGKYIDAINGLDLLETGYVALMNGMFYSCGEYSDSFTLDLGDDFSTVQAITMADMFAYCGMNSEAFTLNLGKMFYTLRVGDMSGMFAYCGMSSKVFTLDLGTHFDTDGVSDMSRMFESCGQSSEVFTLNLGDKFDTSRVTDMRNMFNCCGLNSTVFTLDLGDLFDTANVTDMRNMFNSCGLRSTAFTLDLGDLFDTANVTDMRDMFNSCGQSSEVFTLDLGDLFDTANVTDMSRMFAYCGAISKAFTQLDLSGFTVSLSDSEKLTRFAYFIPVTSFVFGEGWADAALPASGAFTAISSLETSVTGATSNLIDYNWTADRRTVTFPDKSLYTVTAVAETGGAVSGGGTVAEGGSITLTASAKAGYTFDGWYDGDAKICDTTEFVVTNVSGDKTYTAKFTKDIVYYTITAVAEAGGAVSGGGTVAEGGSITLTASAKAGYTFDGWYDGDTKVCDTTEFVAVGVSGDKTYTAKFTKDGPVFDFTSLRTLGTKNITVNQQTKTIDIEAADAAGYITIFVHQKEIIPGGTFRMASYLGNRVIYDQNGSYRVYFVHNFTVSVKANITIDGVSEQYLVNVNFDASKANFDFTSLKGERLDTVSVNHSEKTIHITASAGADDIILYVNQHSTIYGGKLRMASYLGNRVTYDPNGVYTIYANGKNSVSVKANITINGVVEQYLITVDFPSVVWGFDDVKAENVKNVTIDHENKVITIDTVENCDSILLYIDQICQSNIKGQIWMKSYMGNKVVYNAADRTYTISKRDKSSILVKTKITMLGETRYYDIVINFA